MDHDNDGRNDGVPGGGAIRAGTLAGARAGLPLLIEPGEPGTAGAPTGDPDVLAGFLTEHRAWIEQKLAQHGAILFRGFGVRRPEAFERVARGVAPDLKNNYLGTSPRNGLTPYVFSASELPPYYPIPQHCEMSFTREPPRRLFFCCLVAPSGPGGETPLVDFRAVLRDLDPAVRARFEAKGIRNIRNYSGPDGGARMDLWKLKRWDEMFGTRDRSAVEQACRENGFEYTWKPRDELRLVNVQPAVRPHPETGEPVWFNHAQVFHLSSAPAEYRRIAAHQGRLRYRLLAGLARALTIVKARTVSDLDQAMHCTFGDGTPIDDRDLDRVRDAIWGNMVFFPWREGDVVAIDNFAVAHGRMPFEGPREIAVAWA